MDKVALMGAVREALAEIEAEKVVPIEVRRLRLEPGDVLVVKTYRAVSREQAAAWREALQPLFPDNQILMLENGIELEIAGGGGSMVIGEERA